MVQGYYTLQEAAQFLEISLEELKKMSQKNQIRSFQDRGTLRFRIQDIQELARLRGGASDPGLLLGDASLSSGPKTTPPPPSSGKRKSQVPGKTSLKQDAPEVFDFEFDNEDVNIGAEIGSPPGSSKSRPSSKSKKTGPHTPPGSDSDVRLVADGSDVTFNVTDSEAKRGDSQLKIPSDVVKPRPGAAFSSGGKRSSQVSLGSGVQQPPKTGLSGKMPPSPRPTSGPQPIDSGVRLVPMDDDSVVKILGASDEVSLGEKLPSSIRGDSNVRLERVKLPSAGGGSQTNMMMTEEINLDDEIRREEEREKNRPAAKVKPKSELKFPTASPFELSESEMKMPSGAAGRLRSENACAAEKKRSRQQRLRPGDAWAGFGQQRFRPDDRGRKQQSNGFDPGQRFQPGGGGRSARAQSRIPCGTERIDERDLLENPADAGISLEEAGAHTEADEQLEFDPQPGSGGHAEIAVEHTRRGFQQRFSAQDRRHATAGALGAGGGFRQ